MDRPPAMELRLHLLLKTTFDLASPDFNRGSPVEEIGTRETFTDKVGLGYVYSIVPLCGLICVLPSQRALLLPQRDCTFPRTRSRMLESLAERKYARFVVNLRRH